ncbi:MAG: DinB family protein [Ignavibacteriae bacterium]|nr:DinB family protein [Ignavibacteriota bacterium]MCB9242954.1 DinB family protein [Ignavibacteriales bacterium]
MEFETYDILFGKKLDSLKEELLAYKNEEDIWKLHGDIKNTPANLAMHLCGNLKHFFGAIIGNTGYERNRDYEFTVKDLSRDEIVKEIESTKEAIMPVLKSLSLDDLNKKYPTDDFGENLTVGWVITGLGYHLGYHLGQINYHRRMFNY